MYIAVEKTDSEYVSVFFIVKYKVNKLQKKFKYTVYFNFFYILIYQLILYK